MLNKKPVSFKKFFKENIDSILYEADPAPEAAPPAADPAAPPVDPGPGSPAAPGGAAPTDPAADPGAVPTDPAAPPADPSAAPVDPNAAPPAADPNAPPAEDPNAVPEATSPVLTPDQEKAVFSSIIKIAGINTSGFKFSKDKDGEYVNITGKISDDKLEFIKTKTEQETDLALNIKSGAAGNFAFTKIYYKVNLDKITPKFGEILKKLNPDIPFQGGTAEAPPAGAEAGAPPPV